jgi:hypothetical protein
MVRTLPAFEEELEMRLGSVNDKEYLESDRYWHTTLQGEKEGYSSNSDTNIRYKEREYSF